MKVLMFGWEFPPHISGGLGTACHGITKALSDLKVEVTFVLPKIIENYNHSPIRIIGPKVVATEVKRDEHNYEHLKKRIQVGSTLHPYMDKEVYKNYLQKEIPEIKNSRLLLSTDGSSEILDLGGGYGVDLMGEVNRFAVIGKYLGQKEKFDVIHAHDWMSFLAAIEAKKESRKPLIIHVHSTEFDRAGNSISTEVYCIE